jgi:hypothetical protein
LLFLSSFIFCEFNYVGENKNDMDLKSCFSQFFALLAHDTYFHEKNWSDIII